MALGSALFKTLEKTGVGISEHMTHDYGVSEHSLERNTCFHGIKCTDHLRLNNYSVNKSQARLRNQQRIDQNISPGPRSGVEMHRHVSDISSMKRLRVCRGEAVN